MFIKSRSSKTRRKFFFECRFISKAWGRSGAELWDKLSRSVTLPHCKHKFILGKWKACSSLRVTAMTICTNWDELLGRMTQCPTAEVGKSFSHIKTWSYLSSSWPANYKTHRQRKVQHIVETKQSRGSNWDMIQRLKLLNRGSDN